MDGEKKIEEMAECRNYSHKDVRDGRLPEMRELRPPMAPARSTRNL